MENQYFQLGQLLKLADQFHILHCKRVVGGQIPRITIGSDIFEKHAARHPQKALAVLTQRLPDYVSYATKMEALPNEPSITRNEAIKLKRQLVSLFEALNAASWDANTDDKAKSKLLLGYLAGPQQPAATITLYYHHSRMLGMYRSGWFVRPAGDDNHDVYDDGAVELALPEDYTVEECVSATMEVYGPSGQHTSIITVGGHPCVLRTDTTARESIRLTPAGDAAPSEVPCIRLGCNDQFSRLHGGEYSRFAPRSGTDLRDSQSDRRTI